MSAAGDPGASLIHHASCVAAFGRGVLITGPSGAGKSSLALDLMSRGAVLVADDRTETKRRGDAVIASCPATIRGRIEARGVGILAADTLPEAEVALIVDLAQAEAERLPRVRHLHLHGLPIALVRGAGNAHLSAAVLHYLRAGRVA